jgi:hypothetical protein
MLAPWMVYGAVKQTLGADRPECRVVGLAEKPGSGLDQEIARMEARKSRLAEQAEAQQNRLANAERTD